MSTRNISKIIMDMVSEISLLFLLSLFADTLYEKYHAAYEDLSKDVLKNTVGILTINSGIKKGNKLKTYLRNKRDNTY